MSLGALKTEAMAYVEAIASGLPGFSGVIVRRRLYERRLGRLGREAILRPGLLVAGARNVAVGVRFSCQRLCTLWACDDGSIEIGDRVSFNVNVYLNACMKGRIVLGNDVLVGPNVVLRTSDHVTTDVAQPISVQGHVGKSIIVEDDVWIGANVTIVGGTRIGRGAVVAAGAVVVDDVDAYTIVGGVPARPIKKRGA